MARATYNAKKSLHAKKISVAHGELHLNRHSILQVLIGLLILLLWDEVAHNAQPVSKSEGDVQAGPPTRSLIRLLGVMLVYQMHECRLMEEREHAIEIFEVVFQERKSFSFRRQWSVYSSLEQISENVWFPLDPFVVVDRSGRYHILERTVASLVVDPLDALRREDGEAR